MTTPIRPSTANRVFSSMKGRFLFKAQDIVKYNPRMSHNDWYRKKPFAVIEDESPKEHSGVWVTHISDSVSGEYWVMYRRPDGAIGKAEVLYNFNLSDGQLELQDLKDKTKIVVHKDELIGVHIKDYIIIPAFWCPSCYGDNIKWNYLPILFRWGVRLPRKCKTCNYIW